MVAHQPNLRFLALLVTLLFVAAACKPSAVKDPDADVVVSGRLLSNKSPVGNHLVRLTWKHAGFTFKNSTESVESNTDEDGRFTFELKGEQLNYPGRGGGARTFTLEARPADISHGLAGPYASASFKINVVDLPIDLTLWEANARQTQTGLAWQALPQAVQGNQTGYELRVDAFQPETRTDPESAHYGIWHVKTTSTSPSVDARIFEDTSGSFWIEATGETEAPGSKVRLESRSGRFPYAGPAGAPPSRGATCHLDLGRYRFDFDPAPCPLTDGSFDTTYGTLTSFANPEPTDPETPSGTPTWAVIDLGAPTDVGLLVVRGCKCPVASSLDGRDWRPLTSAEEYITATEFDHPTRARYLRVRLDSAGITEVSVWPPRGPAG